MSLPSIFQSKPYSNLSDISQVPNLYTSSTTITMRYKSLKIIFFYIIVGDDVSYLSLLLGWKQSEWRLLT
jgi:hypothetical protein